jgi:hypothetical protein
MSNYIYVGDDVLDPALCDRFIEIFTSNQDLHQSFNGNPGFTQLNYGESVRHSKLIQEYMLNAFEVKNLHNTMVQTAIQVYKRYMELHSELDYLPRPFKMEDLRIKHYRGNGMDRFNMHIDTASANTANRYLAMFWYLNDVEEGGHTNFPVQNMSIQPRRGRVVVFPPFWTHPHEGLPVTKGEKYLMSTYMHYRNDNDFNKN